MSIGIVVADVMTGTHGEGISCGGSSLLPLIQVGTLTFNSVTVSNAICFTGVAELTAYLLRFSTISLKQFSMVNACGIRVQESDTHLLTRGNLHD